MKLKINQTGEFIPKWNDNENEENPIKFEFTKITPALMAKIVSKKVIYRDDEPEITIEFDFDKIVKNCITKIENLEINGAAIRFASEILKQSGLGDLITEIGSHILQESNSVEKKN